MRSSKATDLAAVLASSVSVFPTEDESLKTQSEQLVVKVVEVVVFELGSLRLDILHGIRLAIHSPTDG